MFKTISFDRLENFQSPDLEALAQAMAGAKWMAKECRTRRKPNLKGCERS